GAESQPSHDAPGASLARGAQSRKSSVMILHRLHGALFLLLGVVSVADGWRIAQQAREGANFDAIGPDRYLIALGAAMLLAGLWRLLRGPPPETVATVPDRDAGATSSLLLTLGML